MDYTMMIKTIIAAAVALSLTGCGTLGGHFRELADLGPQDPTVSVTELKKQERIAEPATGALTVAVYNFRDLTGQRKASNTLASLSSAVTQGADAYLIRSLQTVGEGRWFKVVERGNIDNLIKERQIIRQMRELYEGKDAKPLPPMMFAGILLEGGIVGYDSNTMSGGSGVRILGIGPQTEYRQDEVIISIRAVSVATGEVLTSVTVSKTVISYQDKLGVLRFNELGTQAVEAEVGSATNESMNKAVQLAIQSAVIETIKQGAAKGHWQFKAQEAKKEQ
jgi:curli production assembly/transport component CsgG